MPLYEYACPSCNHTFETLVYDTDEKVECPQCHGAEVQRLLSLPAKPRMAAPPMPSCSGAGTCGNSSCPRFQ